MGWNLVYGNVLSIPSEITAICVLFQFWAPPDVVSPAVYIAVFVALTAAVGFSVVRVFGEVEFVFALLKVALVVFLVVLGLVIDTGGIPGTPAVGFRYWRDPGRSSSTWPRAPGAASWATGAS